MERSRSRKQRFRAVRVPPGRFFQGIMFGPQLPGKFNRGRFFDRAMLAQREIVPIVTGYDSRTRSWKEFDVPFEAVGDTYRKPLVLVVSAALGSAPENFCMDLKYTRRAAVVGVTRTSGYSGSMAFIHLRRRDAILHGRSLCLC